MTITSATVGTTVVSATSNIPVNGVTITRTTGTAVNTAAGGSGNASKNWVDANISITPATANNPVGTNHVLTITVNALGGTIDAGPHTATASIVSGPGIVRRLADLHLHGWRRDGELHGDDHVGARPARRSCRRRRTSR